MDMQSSGGAGAGAGAGAGGGVLLRRTSQAASWLLITLALAAAVHRDVTRRDAGLPRRNAAQVIAALLECLPVSVSKRLADFALRHHTTTYVVGAVSVFILFKYQQYLRRWMVRGRQVLLALTRARARLHPPA